MKKPRWPTDEADEAVAFHAHSNGDVDEAVAFHVRDPHHDLEEATTGEAITSPSRKSIDALEEATTIPTRATRRDAWKP